MHPQGRGSPLGVARGRMYYQRCMMVTGRLARGMQARRCRASGGGRRPEAGAGEKPERQPEPSDVPAACGVPGTPGRGGRSVGEGGPCMPRPARLSFLVGPLAVATAHNPSSGRSICTPAGVLPSSQCAKLNYMSPFCGPFRTPSPAQSGPPRRTNHTDAPLAPSPRLLGARTCIPMTALAAFGPSNQ